MVHLDQEKESGLGLGWRQSSWAAADDVVQRKARETLGAHESDDALADGAVHLADQRAGKGDSVLLLLLRHRNPNDVRNKLTSSSSMLLKESVCGDFVWLIFSSVN